MQGWPCRSAETVFSRISDSRDRRKRALKKRKNPESQTLCVSKALQHKKTGTHLAPTEEKRRELCGPYDVDMADLEDDAEFEDAGKVCYVFEMLARRGDPEQSGHVSCSRRQ
ncbi:unnamed protein product [Symbiodinium sp. CCMP2592]|nr:unnamed protein product [Symbiodinium sp. CCMP2592]